ncbi:MAG: Na(+)/H(+) antiporter subunit D [Pseudomonadota bacterium]
MTDSLLPAALSPGVIFILTGLLAYVAPLTVRRPLMLAGIALSALQLSSYGPGLHVIGSIAGFETAGVHIDKLSMLFAIVFHIAAALNVIYGWFVTDRAQTAAGLVYPGAALGGVLSGDLMTLFVYWEIAALSSVFLIWASKDEASYKAGMRYLIIQIASGVLLLGGVVLHARMTGSLAFTGAFSLRDETGALVPSALLLFIAFGIKSAFPLLHNWVQDSYPKSTISGTIILSVFTTKLAVYSLARGFPGTSELIWIGAVMTIFPIFFALIENDLRKVLTYSINNQVGFMVVGIGIGTPIALNGAVGYAFCNIIFESLLFMSVGAVMYRTGTSKATELGGLYKSMPLTTTLCIIGALSISAFPLFAGFVTKGMIIDGVAKEHMTAIWLILLFASAGVLEHAGIKIPYFAFFAHDSGKRPAEAPFTMQLAMGISAVLCVVIGLFPNAFYALLPAEVEYHPYTAAHVVTQLQLLLFAILAFVALVKFKLYPPEVPSTNLDFDWLYRVPGRKLTMWGVDIVGRLWSGAWYKLLSSSRTVIDRVYWLHGPEGRLARTWPLGSMALWTAILLGVLLVVNYL